MFSGGQNLRALREQLGLTMRDVEGASAQIAERHGNDEFSIPPSRLSDVETKGVVPSIYRLYSLAVIYRRDVRELLSWYGIDLNNAASDIEIALPRRSHYSETLSSTSHVRMPVRLDPSFAMGYARLGVAYSNQGAITKAVEYLKKAYDLRERVTERERMYIEAQYALQQYDLPKALQAYKLFVATYPRDAAAWNNLANAYGAVGDLEQARIVFQR